MKQSVLVLLSRSMDYAGMIPPAALPLEQAVARYAALLAGPHRWLVGRFVCPAARVGEVESLRAADGSPPTVLALLGAAADSLEGLAGQAVADRERLRPLLARGGLVADQYEVVLPPAVVAGGVAAVTEAARAVTTALAAPRRLLVVLEVPVAGASTQGVAEVVEGLAKANRESPSTPVCLKVGCGGTSAAAVPTVDELAAVVTACRDQGVLFKATQGLQQPFRRLDSALGCAVHGFVNLFAAVVLARTHRLSRDGVAQVLGDEDPGNFLFTDSGFAWRDHPASLEALAAGRRWGMTSFGSCSVEEPVAHLGALGLLD